ncbi:hypothetical protein [Kitasatospora sp. NPDC094011]|uniref:hypothetical protein n=1 Tax=Kitasatospora sp. NPDC094011 TaxID=3364090 RepID=UPI00381CB058
MELKVLVSTIQWLHRAKKREKLAELTSPLGVIDLFRGPMGELNASGQMLERWEFLLDGAELLVVNGMGTPGYGARRQVAAGLDIVLQGAPGRLNGARGLRSSRRFISMTAGEIRLEARPQWPRYVVRDSSGKECATTNGKAWTFTSQDPALVAFAAYFASAAMEPMLTSPLLEIF